MKPFFTVLLFYSWLTLSAWSQTTTFPQPLSQVRQFLGLTDSQVSAILQNNNSYNDFSFQQQQTIQHAQAQIAVETAQDPLDPIALGNLYAGIESACRELRDRAATTQKQNISILTDAQKAKLNMLSDAIKLAPIISEAQSGNLLGSPISSPFGFSNFIVGGFTSVIGFPPVAGCGVNAVKSGVFTPLLPSPAQPGAAELSTTPAPANPNVNHWFDRTDFVRIPGSENGLDQVRKPILEPR